MSNCSTCIRHDRDCVIDPPDGVECKQYYPSLLAGIQKKPAVENENPDHYRNKSVEPIDAMRSWLGDAAFAQYCRASIIKYMSRLGDKDDAVTEAKKAQVYARWLVETLAGKELSK